MLIVVAMLTLGGSAKSQQPAYAASIDLDTETQTAIARELSRARDRGLPVEPLVAKVREGRIKSAPGPRIRTAVVALSGRLDSARVALGSTATAAEIIAGADALQYGAPSSSLRAIRGATTLPVAVSLGTLAQLVASGVSAKRATEMVVELLRRNAKPAQILALGNLVEMDVVSGLKPDESAAFRLRGIEGSTGDAVTTTVAAPALPGDSRPPATAKPMRRP